MTTYEIQITIGSDYHFEYVTAASEQDAVAIARAGLTKTARRWANVIPTGR